ncbi:MAG: 16S rRNA (cytidine(1402)-2'-O)-methyltransferase [Deltaproteobacteria bacterium]|nr:16S rRNA (cytidine(1402)-2'-O)-methyltransferase [Deltaproteobacteria bacterium]
MKDGGNKIQDSYDQTSIRNGVLYIVPTPIGNLEDITLRALKILRAVELIAAENIRHTKGLCGHYGIKTRLTSYNQHNHKQKGPILIRRLKSGTHVALVTNAGTPAISDPGSMLADMALDEGITVSPIPGPSAVTAALSASGMQGDRFLFLGFLSNKAGKRKKELEMISHEPRTMVFYEAPHRILDMLKDLKTVLGNRRIVLFRELSKLYEEVKRAPVDLLLEELQKHDIRGEFTLVVEGEKNHPKGKGLQSELYAEIERMLKKGDPGIRDLATLLSKEKGLSYRTAYRECLAVKRNLRHEINGFE